MNDPMTCPRCETPSKRLGSEWCCRELKLLKQLMTADVLPDMAVLTRVHFIGRSPKSIDNACRRYGLKTPVRIKKRRPRCEICSHLHDGPGKACSVCAVQSEERRAA